MSLRNRFICESCGAMVYYAKNSKPEINLCNKCIEKSKATLPYDPMHTKQILVKNENKGFEEKIKRLTDEDEVLLPLNEKPTNIKKLEISNETKESFEKDIYIKKPKSKYKPN